ncbi:unnamed protein product [Cyprideis torosa]|uniref:Uncharacterized protein n=1 Tax=Cyprideis torosa TaxID=163714 RepID=A0A7R8WH66_9CRUS|nr:unnamed protein product [Cyprideis torosa]CAG0893455.1 unnamed protein product [Cyprideis torosa]
MFSFALVSPENLSSCSSPGKRDFKLKFHLGVQIFLCLGLVAADYDDDHHKSTIVKEETIGREYADWKVHLDPDSYKYHVNRKLEQDQGNGKEYSDDYRKVSAKIIPHKGYIVDDHHHKKEHVYYEIPFKAEWGVEQKLPIVQRTPIKEHHY